jgi:hypothetical protein
VTERRQPASNPQEATTATTLFTWTSDPERGAIREAPHLAIAAVQGLDRGLDDQPQVVLGNGSGSTCRTERWVSIASPIGMLRRE